MNHLQTARQAAIDAADAGAAIIDSYLHSGNWSVHTKADATPVTEVDVAVENAVFELLAAALPDAAFHGEETGHHDGRDIGADRLCWLVDPIDGTKSFVRGSRYYSTQIALMQGDELVLGVSNAPAYGERLVAVRGAGVELNGVPVSTGACTALDDAYLSVGNLSTLAADTDRWQRLGSLIRQVRRLRGYGDFCHYHQLCCGQADIVIESDVNILDIAALTVAVREAGGIITDLSGAPVTLKTTSVLAAANPVLHAEVLQRLGEH